MKLERKDKQKLRWKKKNRKQLHEWIQISIQTVKTGGTCRLTGICKCMRNHGKKIRCQKIRDEQRVLGMNKGWLRGDKKHGLPL